MLVTREDAAGIATLTLNRPEKLNAITPALMVDLREHIDQMARDDSVRCVILTGAGRSCCSGHDLSAIASDEHAPSRHYEPETIDALENLPRPTIAKIHGHRLPEVSNWRWAATCWWPRSQPCWATPTVSGGSRPSGGCRCASPSASAPRAPRS